MPGIVEIDDGCAQTRPSEEHRLGIGIGLHAAVIVEMVASQVGVDRDRNARAVEPMLMQPDRRRLDGNRLVASLGKARKKRLHSEGIGRGEPGLLERPGASGTQRADDRAGTTQALQALRNPLAATGLAIGAGDRNHIKRSGGMIMIDIGDGSAGALETDDIAPRHRTATCGRRLGDDRAGATGFTDNGAGPSFDCPIDEASTVSLLTGIGEKGITRPDCTTIGHECRAGRQHGAQPAGDFPGVVLRDREGLAHRLSRTGSTG